MHDSEEGCTMIYDSAAFIRFVFRTVQCCSTIRQQGRQPNRACIVGRGCGSWDRRSCPTWCLPLIEELAPERGRWRNRPHRHWSSRCRSVNFWPCQEEVDLSRSLYNLTKICRLDLLNLRLTSFCASTSQVQSLLYMTDSLPFSASGLLTSSLQLRWLYLIFCELIWSILHCYM